MYTLFHHSFCPHSRFIRLALGEYGLDVRLVEERVWERRETFLALNPAGTTPVLISDDQPAIPGAAIIAEYLDETHGADLGERRLLPTPMSERIEVRRLMAWFNEKFFEEASNPLVTERIYKRFMNEEDGGGADEFVLRQTHGEEVNGHDRAGGVGDHGGEAGGKSGAQRGGAAGGNLLIEGGHAGADGLQQDQRKDDDADENTEKAFVQRELQEEEAGDDADNGGRQRPPYIRPADVAAEGADGKEIAANQKGKDYARRFARGHELGHEEHGDHGDPGEAALREPDAKGGDGGHGPLEGGEGREGHWMGPSMDEVDEMSPEKNSAPRDRMAAKG